MPPPLPPPPPPAALGLGLGIPEGVGTLLPPPEEEGVLAPVGVWQDRAPSSLIIPFGQGVHFVEPVVLYVIGRQMPCKKIVLPKMFVRGGGGGGTGDNLFGFARERE